MSGLSSQERLGLGCLVLILLLFGTVGLGCGVGAWFSFAGGNWKGGVILGIMALAFGGVGFGLLAALLNQRRKMLGEQQRQASHPHEPWRWREDWSAGRVRSTSKTLLLRAWLVAALWNLLCLGFITVPAETYRRDILRAPWIVAIALLFPTVGLWLLFWAVRETLRRRKFGESWLELAAVPVRPGRALAATLRTPAPLTGAQAVKLTLSCSKRVVQGSGDTQTIQEQVLWQEEQWIQKMDDVPVYFPLPAEAAPASPEDSDCKITWRLEASAELPGIDYAAQFEIPVFLQDDPAPALPDAAAPFRTAAPAALQPASASRPIHLVREGPGRLRIDYPARRNPKAALVATLFLFFFGFFFFLTLFEAAYIFALILGGLELLLLAVTLSLWFGATCVVIDEAELRINTSILGYRRTRVFPVGAIANIQAAIGMQVGTKVYYDIQVRLTDGNKVAAGSSIANKSEAEQIAAQMRDAAAGGGKR